MSKHAVQKKNPLDNSYWQYFLHLESDFHATTQYIACTETNDATCSIEFAKQIVCICTECEAVLKKICKTIDPKNQAVNMRRRGQPVNCSISEPPKGIEANASPQKPSSVNRSAIAQ